MLLHQNEMIWKEWKCCDGMMRKRNKGELFRRVVEEKTEKSEFVVVFMAGFIEGRPRSPNRIGHIQGIMIIGYGDLYVLTCL